MVLAYCPTHDADCRRALDHRGLGELVPPPSVVESLDALRERCAAILYAMSTDTAPPIAHVNPLTMMHGRLFILLCATVGTAHVADGACPLCELIRCRACQEPTSAAALVAECADAVRRALNGWLQIGPVIRH